MLCGSKEIEPMTGAIKKTVIGVCSILPWLLASGFAMKWFSHMAKGTISYGSEASKVMLQGFSLLAFVGLAGAIILCIASFKWKPQTKWQVVLFFAGMILLLCIVGD